MTFKNYELFIISCESLCSQGYTFMASNMTIHRYEKPDRIGLMQVLYSRCRFIPECRACPVGASCNPPNTPNSLHDCWGYSNQSGYVTMIRCPPEYYCTGNGTCEGIDSCNAGRTGTLCGTCRSNLTEALFSAKCLPFKNCRDTLIVVMYLLCVVGYSIMLLVSETIENTIMEAFKKLSKNWKQRKHCKKHKDTSDNVQELADLSPKAGTSVDNRKANSNKPVSADDKCKNNLLSEASDSKSTKQRIR